MTRFMLSISFLMILCASQCYAEGLDTLIEVAGSQADIQREYARETKAFEGVKRAVDNGSIKKGQAKEDVRARYGEPVVIVDDTETGREKWVYKSANSTFFEGIRVYLFFDKDGSLDEVVAKK